MGVRMGGRGMLLRREEEKGLDLEEWEIETEFYLVFSLPPFAWIKASTLTSVFSGR
jgi:hypothetical protein